MPHQKKYYTKEDGLTYKVCNCCKRELTIDKFSTRVQNGKYTTFSPNCKKCHSHKQKLNYRSIILENRQLKAWKDGAMEVMARWNAVDEWARIQPDIPLGGSISEYVLSKLKSIENGR